MYDSRPAHFRSKTTLIYLQQINVIVCGFFSFTILLDKTFVKSILFPYALQAHQEQSCLYRRKWQPTIFSARDVPGIYACTFTSADETVAAVDEKLGTVTAAAPGMTTVTMHPIRAFSTSVTATKSSKTASSESFTSPTAMLAMVIRVLFTETFSN